jgi:hypothetical protein
MLGPVSTGGVDVAALGCFPSATAMTTGLGSGDRLARCAWGHLRGGVHVGAEGLRSKARASPTWCVVWGAHGGSLLLHVAVGTGHPGGGIYPMGLRREGAENVEHPTEFLLKAYGHVVELVELCMNLLLPQLEVVQHTGRIHRIVTYASCDGSRWCWRRHPRSC